MKTSELNPLATFKHLRTGSTTAKNLSILYVLASLILAYKMRDHVEYLLPLVIGALMVLWYTFTYLTLKKFDLKKNDLQNHVHLYRDHILRREKYESTVFFIWFLTIVPTILFKEEITIVMVILIMIGIYLISFLGNYLFTKAKRILEELEHNLES